VSRNSSCGTSTRACVEASLEERLSRLHLRIFGILIFTQLATIALVAAARDTR
jgi:hypothetical protein